MLLDTTYPLQVTKIKTLITLNDNKTVEQVNFHTWLVGM